MVMYARLEGEHSQLMCPIGNSRYSYACIAVDEPVQFESHVAKRHHHDREPAISVVRRPCSLFAQRSMMKSRLLRLVFVLSLASSAGCSDIKILYENADLLAMQAIDKNMCPRGKERAAVKSTLRQFLRWHRVMELPRYAAALNRIESVVSTQGFSSEAVKLIFEEGQGAWARMLRRAAPSFSKHLARMAPRQTDCMNAQLEKRRMEWEQRVSGSDREYRRKWFERTERFLGVMFGNFTQPQRAKMMKSGPLERAHEQRMNEHRIAASSAFADVVRSGERKRIFRALKAVARNPWHFYSREGRRLAIKDRRDRMASLVRLGKILKPSQLKFMQKRLRRWAGAFTELAEAAKAQQ